MAVIQEEGDAFAANDMDRLFAVHLQDSMGNRQAFTEDNFTISKGWIEIRSLFNEMSNNILDLESANNVKNNVILKVLDDCAWMTCDNIWEWEQNGVPGRLANVQIQVNE